MSKVFALAVVSAPDAGLLAAAVVLLSRPRPARQLGAYLVGGMGLSIAFGVLIVVALHGSDLLSRIPNSTRGTIEVAAGALLLFVAAAVRVGRQMHWHPRRPRARAEGHSQRPSVQERALGNDSLWIAWAAGAVYSLPGAYYLIGLALLAKLNTSAATNVVVIIAFNLIMFVLIELPLLGLLLLPDRTRSLTEKLNDWMTLHGQMMIIILVGAIGAYLLVSGISTLG